MNYSLAKELKDAGFRQDGIKFAEPGSLVGSEVHYPTLSELIEACSSEFDCLRLIHPDKPKEDYWFAEADSQRVGGIGCDGSTPEEAVARLWLALNKKV